MIGIKTLGVAPRTPETKEWTETTAGAPSVKMCKVFERPEAPFVQHPAVMSA